MKEKLIFWVLVPLLIGVIMYKIYEFKDAGDISPQLMKEQETIKQMKRTQLPKAPELDLAAAQGVRPFTDYAHLIQEGPFFPVVVEGEKPAMKEIIKVELLPRKTVFIYRGISVVKGREVVALESADEGEVFFVGVGDEINQYTVTDITDMEVIITDGEEDISIKRIE
ncbi:MAG: hypothetical protein JW844_06580 [Candidatus Omnitrophica bacterium]|nr:hypothetical protein [Candidatus Omnitrophota bacterium]